MRTLIVGSGIAGPCTAMALQKAGIEAIVLERHRSSAIGIGSFLTLGSNGLDALAAIDATQAVAQLGFATPTLSMSSYTGKALGEARITATTAGAPVSRTMRRADLYQAVYDEAVRRGITIEHGKELVGASHTGNSVTAELSDGTTCTGDLLVGCDGVHSRTHALVEPQAARPAYTGLVGIGGCAPADGADVEPGGFRMIFGRRAFFGYAAPSSENVWWFANLPQRTEPAPGSFDTFDGDDWRERVAELFARDTGPAAVLVKATHDLSPPSPMHTVPRLASWHRDRLVVVGDAAHAPSPSSGQGASLAIEDAVELAKCLRDLASVDRALERFEELRRPRVEAIVRQAERTNSNKAASGLARVARDLVLPFIFRKTASSQHLKDTYDHRTDWTTNLAC